MDHHLSFNNWLSNWSRFVIVKVVDISGPFQESFEKSRNWFLKIGVLAATFGWKTCVCSHFSFSGTLIHTLETSIIVYSICFRTVVKISNQDHGRLFSWKIGKIRYLFFQTFISNDVPKTTRKVWHECFWGVVIEILPKINNLFYECVTLFGFGCYFFTWFWISI